MTASVTLITGASRGIGRACAIRCAKAGHAIAVNYLGNADAAGEAVAEIEALGVKAQAFRADTSTEDAVHQLFADVTSALGPITGLVNNAGLYGPQGKFEDLPIADLDKLLAVNIRGVVLCCQEAIRHMSTAHGGNGGGIVNISSGAAAVGNPGASVVYAATKGAINTLTIGLSQELGAQGIRVNAVSPGFTNTDMQTPERMAAIIPQIPLGRGAEPAEIAEAVYWLLSDAASFTTGANILVAGGRR